MKKIILLFLVASLFVLSADEFYYAHDKKIEVSELRERRNNADTVRYYQTREARVFGVTDEIIVQCKEAKNCLETLEDLKFNNVSRLSKVLFLIKIPNVDNIFEISRKLYENPAIVLAHPNFVKKRERR